MDHTTVARFTTIADVDRQISLVLSDSPILTTGNFITSRLTRFEHPFFNASPADALPRLLVLKELYRVHDAVDRTYAEHARANRARPASASDLEVFRRTFEEIVELTTHRRPEFRSALGRARRFLDLGCAPGGFATWLLQNTGMQGMGITLPSDTSVPGVPVQDALQSYAPRFPVYLEDVCEIARGQSVTDWEKHVPSTGFDLIIANACIMLAESSVPRSTKIRLMYAQLLIALERITAGGTLILSLWMRPFDWVVDIVAILNGSFGSIDAIKPRYQGKTSFAYIVCQDYKITANKPRHIEHLRAVIQHLDSAEAGDIDTPTLPNLFDSGTPDEETVAFIVRLFTPAWQRQCDAIHRDYERVLSGINSGPAAHSSQCPSSPTVSRRLQEIPAGRSNADNSFDWRKRHVEQPNDADYRRRQDQRNTGFRQLFGVPTAVSEGRWR